MAVFIDSFISLSVTLTSPAPIQTGLGPPLYIAIEAATPISGDITTVSSAAGVATLLAATQISAQAAADLTAAFSQSAAPASIWIATYDSSTEDPTDAIDRMEAAENSYGPIGQESRSNTNNALIGTWLAADVLRRWSHPACLQSSEAGLLTSGKPAGLASCEQDGVAMHYHSADAQPQAAAHMGLIGGFPLASGPMALRARIAGVTLPAATTAERAFALANDACLLNAEARGASASQRLIDQTKSYGDSSWTSAITVMYAVQRMQAALQAVVSRHAALATPLYATPDGAAECTAAVTEQLAALAAVGHFTPGVTGNVAFPDGYRVVASVTGTTITLTVTLRLGQEATSIALSVVGEVI